MSDPTDRSDPTDEHTDIDLVPGDPPVPITVWRAPATTAGMSARLAARLLAAYSRRGDAVHDATGDAEFAHAMTAAGRRPLARTAPGGDPADLAALVLTGWPLPDRGIDPVIVLGALRRRLRPGGVLVALVANPAPGGQPVEAGPLVHAAGQARLSYLQHIVAVTAATDGDQITPTAADGTRSRRRRGGGPAHLRVHTDLLVFTPAGGQHG